MQTMQTHGFPPAPIKALSASAGIPLAAIQRPTATAGISSTPIKALSASAGISPAHIKTRSATAGIPSAPRSAFTLVELLVVIGIIALLAAIVTPAVMRAQATARNAAIKAEIDMLHMAIMNYKNEYGSFPPGDDTRLEPASPPLPASPAWTHVNRLFPRCASSAIKAQLLGGFPSTADPKTIVCRNAICYWLLGYTEDPASPLSPNTSRKKLYDFDQSRVDPVTGVYFPVGKPGSPYIYIPASQYVLAPYTTALINTNGTGAHFVPPPTGPSALPTNKLLWFTNLGLAGTQQQSYANPDTFQILCAGRDETFGTDDDLSNFWPGTRKDYIDSLTQ